MYQVSKEDLNKKNVIYKITTPSNKIYIGQTSRTFIQRINDYKRGQNRKNTYNYPIFKAIRKYGFNNLIFEIIDTALTQKELDAKEIYWIQKYNSLSNKGYNCNHGGKSGGVKKLSQERKVYLSKLNSKKVYIYDIKNRLVFSGYLRSKIKEKFNIHKNSVANSINGKCGRVKDYWITTKKGAKYIPTDSQIEEARIKMNQFAETLSYTIYYKNKKVGIAKGRKDIKRLTGFKYIRDVDKIIKSSKKWKNFSADYEERDILRIRNFIYNDFSK